MQYINGISLLLPAYGRVGQGQHSLVAHFAKRNTKNCGGEKRSDESEGGQKFLSPPNPLPFCPPERSVLVLPREARQSFRILFKMSSDFFQQTPPKFIYRGISLARRFAPRFGGHFRKEMPRVFEINRQFPRRKAAVHPVTAGYCGKAAMSRWFFSAFGGKQNKILQIVGVKRCLFIKLKTSKTMIKYFIYCRKSSEDEERQVLSIEAQLAELREFAKQNNLFIVREFTESKTAKEPGREIFNQMLSEIEKGNASGILAWNPDRLARNSVDGGRVIYLVDTGKIQSLKFPTFWFEATPQGKFMLSVAFGQAKHYTDNLRENILRGIRQKIRRGELSAKAPLGYFNEPRLRTIEPDRKTFNKVKEILRAFATGNYTLSQIRDKMFSLGLVGPKSGKKMSLSSVEHILKNPFYYGHFLYRGELHQGSHKPMISKKLFDKIQEALRDNGKPRKKPKVKNFPFLGFAKCGECGYTITAEKQVKKSGLEFIYYHCTHKSKTQRCSQRGFLREEKLAEQIKEQWKVPQTLDTLSKT